LVLHRSEPTKGLPGRLSIAGARATLQRRIAQCAEAARVLSRRALRHFIAAVCHWPNAGVTHQGDLVNHSALASAWVTLAFSPAAPTPRRHRRLRTRRRSSNNDGLARANSVVSARRFECSSARNATLGSAQGRPSRYNAGPGNERLRARRSEAQKQPPSALGRMVALRMARLRGRSLASFAHVFTQKIQGTNVSSSHAGVIFLSLEFSCLRSRQR
jgi:hypothetical protein